jgi:hypothetical protein
MRGHAPVVRLHIPYSILHVHDAVWSVLGPGWPLPASVIAIVPDVRFPC